MPDARRASRAVDSRAAARRIDAPTTRWTMRRERWMMNVCCCCLQLQSNTNVDEFTSNESMTEFAACSHDRPNYSMQNKRESRFRLRMRSSNNFFTNAPSPTYLCVRAFDKYTLKSCRTTRPAQPHPTQSTHNKSHHYETTQTKEEKKMIKNKMKNVRGIR